MEERLSTSANPSRRVAWKVLSAALFVGGLYSFTSGLILGLSERSGSTTSLERICDLRTKQKTLQAIYRPLAGVSRTTRTEIILNRYLLWCGAENAARELLALPMLKSARAAMKLGDWDQAERLAARAKLLDAQYGLFDDRPEQVLVQIERSRMRK